MKKLIKLIATLMTMVMLMSVVASCARKPSLPKKAFNLVSFRQAFDGYQYYDDEEQWKEFYYNAIAPNSEVRSIFYDGVMASAGDEVYDENVYPVRQVFGYLVPSSDRNNGLNFYDHGLKVITQNYGGSSRVVESESSVTCNYVRCDCDEFYGGYYWLGDMIIAVYAVGNEFYPVVDAEARAEVDRVLTELELPLPSEK